MAHKKVYVLIDDPPLDIKAYVPHISEAAGKKLHLDRDKVTLRDTDNQIVIRVGDAVDVRVTGRDRKRERWKLALTKHG
jgi:exoribonuclease R